MLLVFVKVEANRMSPASLQDVAHYQRTAYAVLLGVTQGGLWERQQAWCINHTTWGSCWFLSLFKKSPGTTFVFCFALFCSWMKSSSWFRRSTLWFDKNVMGLYTHIIFYPFISYSFHVDVYIQRSKQQYLPKHNGEFRLAVFVDFIDLVACHALKALQRI